jgi:tRNA U38,U39,U40 pseudouridine synthase TruA
MVRKIVGAILAVNEGKMTLEEFKDLLDNPEIGKCKYKAEPGGLYKVKTYYPKTKLKK